MVYYLQSANESNRILEILDDVNIRGEMMETLIKVEDMLPNIKLEQPELLLELGVIDLDQLKKLMIVVQMIHLYEENYCFFLEPDFHFNRYRLITLRTSLYNNNLSFDLQKVRSFCRTKEKEAAKSGYQKEIWANTIAQQIFGTSEEPGDFTGKGSAGWKLNALSNYFLDVYSKEKDLNIIRLNYYDTIMVQGKLEQIGSHLKLKNKNFDKPIQQFLARKIGVNLPQG